MRPLPSRQALVPWSQGAERLLGQKQPWAAATWPWSMKRWVEEGARHRSCMANVRALSGCIPAVDVWLCEAWCHRCPLTETGKIEIVPVLLWGFGELLNTGWSWFTRGCCLSMPCIVMSALGGNNLGNVVRLRPDWMRPWATWSRGRCPCLWQGGWTGPSGL